MKISKRLLPVKAHYFFFMASMGPILPQLSVYGKQLGFPPLIMGSVTGILPIVFLLAKPMFGFLADRYRNHRKHIFITLIIAMGVLYAGLYFVPFPKNNWHYNGDECQRIITHSCNFTEIEEDIKCHILHCTSNCSGDILDLNVVATHNINNNNNNNNDDICVLNNFTHQQTCINNNNCDIYCKSDQELETRCVLKSFQFWCFVVLMAGGTIAFNVINSISDAICFDVLGEGEEMSYGKQRVWGTIGFGISALISGFIVDWWSVGDVKSFVPALVIMILFLVIDILCCRKLKLPPMETPANIMKDILNLLKFVHIRIFIVFAALAGIVDSFIIYFFFWYLEELATETNYTHHIKLLEGIIVATETLGGEVIFFSVSGSILRSIGYGNSLSMCFIFYALRLALISTIPNPWWVIPIEFFLQGPTYAMSYTTIVAYASAVSPPGTSATMQGLVAGIDDGFGYAIGSTLGGVLYRTLGGRGALYVFSATALTCAITHAILYATILKNKIPSTCDDGYQEPNDDSIKNTVHDDNNDDQ